MSYESVDNESSCSSLHAKEIVDSDEEVIAELDQMLLKLKFFGVKIKSVANNQAKVINTVKRNSKKISDLKQNTSRKLSEFTDLTVDRMDSCQQMCKAECEYKNLELEKNVRQVEAKVNVLSETSEELHCLTGDLIAKKMAHDKKLKHLEDHQFVLENKLEKNQGSSSAASSWLNKHPMPKFSGYKRERPMRFLRDFERYINATDIRTNDFNYVVFACLDGLAGEWWDLVSLEHENINSFREKFIKKYWNENVCFQISSDLRELTGSEITCISDNSFEDNKNKLKNCKILPIVGTSVVGATGVKPIKLKHQIYADLNVNDETYSCVFIIIPKLNKNCILGIDVLKKLKGRINIEENYVILRNEDKDLKIEFINEERKCIRVIHEINMEPSENLTNIDPQDFADEVNYPEKYEEFRNVKEYELLNREEKKKFWEVLKKYRDIFSKKPGRISIYEHELKIKDDKPFVIKTYPIPMRLRELVTAELNKLLELGIIRRSNSPYINPLVTSLKKDESIRICLDARKLNDIMINDYECAEPTEVLFQRCEGSKIMSTMDLTSNFWPILLAEESKIYTAFLHEGKCYEFCVTPFGLKTSTAAFVRALDFVLNDLGKFYLTYIDDIFCASENVHQHLLHLELLSHRLMENNLTINLEKSHFFRSEVKFLGHVLTSTEIKPDPEKIETIQNFSRPRNLKELRGFLGLINFYTKFSKNHAAKIVPLLELLKKGVK